MVAQLREAGLPIEDVTVYNERTDPNDLLGRPNGYVAKASWRDSRVRERFDRKQLDVEYGGSVEVFESEAEAERRAEYIDTLQEEGGPIFGSE